jgi:transcriptional regulator with PAS, ATPase and Fis domain
MSHYQDYEHLLNKEVFGETCAFVQIKTRNELIKCEDVDQTCVSEIFQTGIKTLSGEDQGGLASFIYYFPIFIRLKVEAILLLFPKQDCEKEFKQGIRYLEKLADLSCKWVSERIENERVKKEAELANAEITNLFSTVTQPLCMISRDGIIQEINDPLASMLQKGRTSLIGGDVTQLLTNNSWELVKKQTRKEEVVLSIQQYSHEFLTMIQPIHWNKVIESFLILVKTKTEPKSKHRPRGLYRFADIKGVSKPLQTAINAAKRVAHGDATIMLRGESGTGKEMFAQSIHHESRRKDQPFIAINCAAIPENLLESELFGYEKGAFTGADKSKPGRFELANKGTIFLDEIGDMPLYLQAKILRVIQEKTIERVGSSQSIDIDVRIITATHQNLENLVNEGKFREDLYYRISVIPIVIPPLRERKEDLPILIEHYLSDFSKSMNRPPKRLSEEVVQRLLHYHWPGNIRELQNVVRHFVELEIGDTVTVESLPASLSIHYAETPVKETANNKKLAVNRDKQDLLRLLDRYGWDTEGKKKTAAELGISLATLYRHLKKIK